MLLTLLLIVQVCGTVHGVDPHNYIVHVPVNETCTANKVRVTKEFTVERRCHTACTNGGTGSLTGINFPDERLCTFDERGENLIPVRETGKCVNGICRKPYGVPIPTMSNPLCSPYKRRLHEGEDVATECTQKCYIRGSVSRETVNLEDGKKCVDPSWVSFLGVTKVGTCQNGTCSDKRIDTCNRKRLSVYSKVNVDEKCKLTCDNGTTELLKNGTMCAFRTKSVWSWIWPKPGTTLVEEIGVCKEGNCVQRDEYKVASHDQTDGCNGTDVVIHENLTVASHCQVVCSGGTTKLRKEGILCLWQYHHLGHHNMFSVGKCNCGSCEPLNDYVVLTKYEDPTQESRPKWY